jgi:hypothetical protein
MARNKDVEWTLPDKLDNWTQVNTAVLMDIRDELKKLNSLMHCSNVIGGFRALQRLDRRLAKKVPLR